MKDLIFKSFKDINLLAIFVIVIACSLIKTNVDPDFWGRISFGSTYLYHGWVLYQDIFSFLDTKAIWVDHEWLSSIIFFLIFKYYGAIGIIILKILATMVCIWLIYLVMRIRIDVDINIVYLFIVLFGIETAFLSNIRSHIFTYIFFAFWLLILEHSRKTDTLKYLWILPVTIIIWANLHAGCIAGVALTGVYAFSNLIQKKIYRPYILIVILSMLLILINPYTYHYYEYIISELTSKHHTISEWEPLNLFEFKNFIYFKIMLILTIIGFTSSFLKKEPLDPAVLILLLTFAVMGILSARHTVLFIMVSGIFSYEHLYKLYHTFLDHLLNGLSQKYFNLYSFFINKGIAVFAIIIFLPSLFSQNLNKIEFNTNQALSGYPVGSVCFIKTNSIKGNILLPYYWGGYVLWNLYPDNKVAVDGRHVQVYSQKMFNDLNDFFFFPAKNKDLIEIYRPDILLLDKNFDDIYKSKIDKNKWQIVFEDKYSVVMLPKSTVEVSSFKIVLPEAYSKINLKKSFFIKENTKK